MDFLRTSIKKSFRLFLAGMALGLLHVKLADAQPYQGFGATTPGGFGGTVVHVTNLDDSGPGSLREALSAGNRTVVFDVGGEINLTSAIRVTGAFITIDGFTALVPITLRGAGLSLHGTKGAHDVIIRGIRIRDVSATASTDGITIAFDASNIVVDRVSICCSKADGNLDITFDSHDVTVSWSILAGSGKNMLIKYNPSRITLHHNILIENSTRNPQVRTNNIGTPATDTTVDMRNNIIWDWKGYGTLIRKGPWVNVVNNYYSSSRGALRISRARAYVSGNVTANHRNLNRKGKEMSPFPAPFVDTQDACAAANLVLADAGVRPFDTIDQQFLSKITIPPCP